MTQYDPEQAFLRSLQGETSTATTPVLESREASAVPKQPRTIGGFIVDDDEDEDEEDSTPYQPQEVGSSGLSNVDRGSSKTPQRALTQSPSVARSLTAVPMNTTAQNQNTSAAATNGATHTVPADHLHAAVQEGSSDSKLIQRPVSTPAYDASLLLPKARLPNDRVGVLEDRIKEDPRGDLDAWLNLIAEHKKRNKLEDVRKTYDRFFKEFPAAAEQLVAYANMELEHNDFYRVEQIFNKSLLAIPNVQLWSTYLNYVRRRNNLSQDASGNARQVVSQAYDFVLQNIGIDKDSGQIWQDYVKFIRDGPGQVGGSNWQDQQKMDSLRKTYQRAICVPTQAVNTLWKEYDAFEMGLNKLTGRKFLQEKSPAYMTARSSNTALQNITRDLNRTSLPMLPPALGFDGDTEYVKQVEIWKRWIEWEKEDPMVLKEEDLAAYKARLLYVYKQAAMALRFWPELWADAADFCFSNGLESEGSDFLSQGATANPESCLLCFKRADRIELTTTHEEGNDSPKRRGDAVREPYDKCLDALYALITQVKHRETQVIARIKENMVKQDAPSPTGSGEGDEEDNAEPTQESPETLLNLQIEAVQKGNAVQVRLLSRTVSFVWIALMRAMRRIQGKGKPNDPIGGSRQIFTDARKRGRLTSDVYVASALIEYHCYKDVAATKIFERGMKLFPEDEQFALEYLKHLIAINDVTNARAVFETTVTRLAAKPELLHKAKPIYAFFHEYEACYGELSQLSKLEKRMSDLFPEDPQLALFSRRYSVQGFDPTAIRPLISPTQARPKNFPLMEQPVSVQGSPRPLMAALPITTSPKRPLDDSDNESNPPPRKIARGESPLKGAAGRRLDAQKRTQLRNEINQNGDTPQPVLAPPPPLLPRDVLFLLSIIPNAKTYNATMFNAERMVNLLRTADLSRAVMPARPPQLPTPQIAPPQYNYGQANGSYGYR